MQRRQTWSWKFFTNHGQVLLCIAQDGQRMGRRNHYKLNRTTTMRHVAKPNQIRSLLDLLQRDQPDPPERRTG